MSDVRLSADLAGGEAVKPSTLRKLEIIKARITAFGGKVGNPTPVFPLWECAGTPV